MINSPLRNCSFDNFHFEGMFIKNLRNGVLYPNVVFSILPSSKTHLFEKEFASLCLQVFEQMRSC